MRRYCGFVDGSGGSVGFIYSCNCDDGCDGALETFQTSHVVVCDYCIYTILIQIATFIH